MNSSDYLRRKTKGLSQTIGFQRGEDSSLQTMKVQARATKTTRVTAVATNHSTIDKTMATNVPTVINASGCSTVVRHMQLFFLVSQLFQILKMLLERRYVAKMI